DVLEFCVLKISEWYGENLPQIHSNSFVSNKTMHSDNKATVDNIIKDIEENKEEYEECFSSPIIEQEKPDISGDNIFIVHGHDDGLKYEVARFLERLGLKPIILHEQSSSG